MLQESPSNWIAVVAEGADGTYAMDWWSIGGGGGYVPRLIFLPVLGR